MPTRLQVLKAEVAAALDFYNLMYILMYINCNQRLPISISPHFTLHPALHLSSCLTFCDTKAERGMIKARLLPQLVAQLHWWALMNGRRLLFDCYVPLPRFIIYCLASPLGGSPPSGCSFNFSNWFCGQLANRLRNCQCGKQIAIADPAWILQPSAAALPIVDLVASGLALMRGLIAQLTGQTFWQTKKCQTICQDKGGRRCRCRWLSCQVWSVLWVVLVLGVYRLYIEGQKSNKHTRKSTGHAAGRQEM